MKEEDPSIQGQWYSIRSTVYASEFRARAEPTAAAGTSTLSNEECSRVSAASHHKSSGDRHS